MEYTEDEILEVVQRWDQTGLLYGIPLYEKQELAPIYDNIARLVLSKTESGEIGRDLSDMMDSVMYPICRRLYRRVGSEFDYEIMISHLIVKTKENYKKLSQPVGTDKNVNPIVEFCIEFADTYEDDIIVKKQFSDEEYTERVDRIVNTLRNILLNKEMVSFVDRTNSDWKLIMSDSKKSPKQTRYWNQKVGQEILSAVLRDTNKGI